MKYLLGFICSIAILTSSCKEQFESSIPYARVSVSYYDTERKLSPVMGFLSLTEPSPSSPYLGYGGILVFHWTESNKDIYLAFDRACPYDIPAKAGVVLTEPGDFKVTCPLCGTQYSLINYGFPDGKGPGKERLKQYPNGNYNTATGLLNVWN